MEIVIRDDTSRFEAMKAIATSDQPMLFQLSPYKPNRSAAQNRIYWAWLTDCETTTDNSMAGSTKDEWHDKFKRMSLSKIYERDDEMYAQTMASLREVYRHGLHTESKNMVDHVIRETSTTKATVEQFTEYLTFIERFCNQHGIRLRTDDRLYAEAMGLS